MFAVAVNTVPDWTIVGVPTPSGTLNWYQREPLRVLFADTAFTMPVLLNAIGPEVL